LGARDSFFRVTRGEGGFGSTEVREMLEEIVSQSLADEEVAKAIANGDL
jgi:hypothetical protein